MIQVQQSADAFTARFYAYCACGVCGPLRRSKGAAMADDRAHRNVCKEAERDHG